MLNIASLILIKLDIVCNTMQENDCLCKVFCVRSSDVMGMCL